jgi:hypothetical protein
MSTPEILAGAGNVEVVCVLALRSQGFTVSRKVIEGHEEWRAERPDLVLIAADPVGLLGLASLRERRGREWRASDEEIDAFFQEFYPDSTESHWRTLSDPRRYIAGR